MRDLTKYMKEKEIRKRVGMFFTDMALEEAMRQGKMLTNNELAHIWGDRGGRSLSAMSLGSWLNGDRVPEGDNKRTMVNAIGMEVYVILGEQYFEAKDELAQEVEKEAPFMTRDDMEAIRSVVERIRKRRGVLPSVENGLNEGVA